MPTYEYECQKCGHRFEQFQSMSDKPIRTCPRCSGRVQRLIGTGGAILVRSGNSSSARCDRTRPCCGREQPCDTPPCEE